jgi:hypothetical protein
MHPAEPSVAALLASLAERDRQLAERDRLIAELLAWVAESWGCGGRVAIGRGGAVALCGAGQTEAADTPGRSDGEGEFGECDRPRSGTAALLR